MANSIFHFSRPDGDGGASLSRPEETADGSGMGVIRQLVRRMLAGEGEEAVDDVLQEVALASHATEGHAGVPANQAAWLRQVAVNKVRDYWRRVDRRRRLRDRLTHESSIDVESPGSPYDWVIAVESSQEVVHALGKLTAEDRSLLEDRYLHERSCEQIAGALGITMKSLEYRLTRARQRMRRILTREP